MLVTASTRRPRTVEDLLAPGFLGRLDRLDVLSRKVFAGKLPGERRSKKRGSGIEFTDYRGYTPGDDLRHIDWKLLARLDRLFIRLFVQEEDLSFILAVDCSASMDAGEPNKHLFCQRLALALGYIGLVNNNRVAAVAFGRRGFRGMAESRGRRNVQRLARYVLDEMAPEPGYGVAPTREGPSAGSGVEMTFADSMRRLAMRRSGKGVIVVMSDFLFPEGYADGLKQLSGSDAFDVYCLQVLAPGEVDPAAASKGGTDGVVGDLRLTDIETGGAQEVTVTAALVKRYRQTLEDYCGELSRFCAARRMRHEVVRSDAEMEGLILETLRKRGMLR